MLFNLFLMCLWCWIGRNGFIYTWSGDLSVSLAIEAASLFIMWLGPFAWLFGLGIHSNDRHIPLSFRRVCLPATISKKYKE